jgi:hypothetical protein
MHWTAPDFRFDLSLGLLSLLVGGSIGVALLWYLVVLLPPLALRDAPPAARTNSALHEPVGPPAWAAVDDRAVLPLALLPALPTLPFVTIFRCEAGGRVSYGDQPCDRGGERVLHLPRG